MVRVGDTVRRPAASPFVRRVLIYLGERGWAGAPRWLGVDERGRDVLSYLDGDVPWQRERQPAMRTDAALAGIATLVRELHDLTAGTELAEGGEVVCHNDLSPRNTVYRDLLPVAILDWDIAAPGRRLHDVAHVCWQFVGLGPGADPHRAGRQVRLVAEAYGLGERGELVDTVLWWQERCWRGIAAKAAAGARPWVGCATAVRSRPSAPTRTGPQRITTCWSGPCGDPPDPGRRAGARHAGADPAVTRSPGPQGPAVTLERTLR